MGIISLNQNKAARESSSRKRGREGNGREKAREAEKTVKRREREWERGKGRERETSGREADGERVREVWIELERVRRF